jgi:hypothetical protein
MLKHGRQIILATQKKPVFPFICQMETLTGGEALLLAGV